MKNKLSVIQLIASLLVFVGVVLKFTSVVGAQYIFSVGVLGLLVLQILYAQRTKNDSFLVKRVASLMFIATAILGLGVYFMFVNNGYWVITVFIYALVSLYLSFRSRR